MNLQHQQFAQMEGLDGGNLAGLSGLEGWGKFKKKLGLNKLHTRKAVAKVAKVIPGAALLVPTKKTLTEAGKGMAVGAAIGAAVVGGPKVVTAVKKIADQVQAKKEQEAAVKKAEAEIERQAAAYEAEMMRQDAASQQAAASGNTAKPTPAAAKPSGSGWLLPAGLVTAALMVL